MSKFDFIEAVKLTVAMAFVLGVFSYILAQRDDFRACYLFAQSAGLLVMIYVGVSSGSQKGAQLAILSALGICAAIDLYLATRGPIYL